MHSAYFRPGGVHQDVPEKLLVDIGEWCEKRLPKLFGDAMSLVIDNRIFKQRNVDIATVSKEDALAWGFSGPMIRGSGIARSEEHTSELQSLMRSSYAVFCLKKKTDN